MLNNRIYQGNCLELMHHLPPGCVDMVLCDLPYGTAEQAWDEVLPFAELWAHYARIVKPEGAIVLTASQPFTSALIASNFAHFRYCWVWDKVSVSNPQLAKYQPLKRHEDVCVFSRKPHMYQPQGLKHMKPKASPAISSETELLGHIVRRADYVQEVTNYPNSIIRFSRPTNPIHPTQKPLELFRYLVKTYTLPGDLVLDNCIGSGSTAIACLATGRKFIGMEQDEAICRQAVERVNRFLFI